MRRAILIILAILFSFSLNCQAQDAIAEFEGRFWITDLDAKVRVVESGIGDKFDLKSDLGIKDEDFPEARFYWHTAADSKIRFTYTQAEFEGDQAVSRSIQFEGQTFTAGSRVVSDLDIKYFSLGWIWQFLNFFNNKVKLGPLLDLKAINAKVSLDALDLGIKESEDFWGGLPTVGLALNFTPVKSADLFAEASGISAGDIGYFFDIEAGVKITPVKYCSIVAGYRMMSLKAEDSSDFAKINLDGPFVGVTLKF